MEGDKLARFLAQSEEFTREPPPPVSQPAGIVNRTMHPHQLVGLSWLVALYKRNMGGILGDEMGLGKTLTSISMLMYLMEEKLSKGPFLIVVPLTVMDNWAKEFSSHAPSIAVLRYEGDKQAREGIREKIVEGIIAQPKAKQRDPDLEFNVLLTSYQTIINDNEFLSKFKFRYGIVDEAQRLKNASGELYTLLSKNFKIAHKLLLTGTPLQNNLKELWSLLHFVAPKVFNDLDLFQGWFEDVDWTAAKHSIAPSSLSEEESVIDSQVQQLHTIIRPYLLRRLKVDVNIKLPDKREILVYTGMSSMQKKYYKWVLTRDVEKLAGATGRHTKNKMSLMNIIMQLRKCCNHPYLFDGAEPLFDGAYKMGGHIIENSGKLSLLDKLLPKLQAENHRVLIFSQMTRMLDILQDYLHYREYNYERLDGSVRGEERYLAIEHFQTKDEDVAEEDRPFVFLLSTRAGGLGLNLTAADTVIFIDSDWNPQADLQAEARVHRMGQDKDVTVIRLITKLTVEEVIFQRALRKLQLSNAIIEEGNFSMGASEDEEKESPEQLFDVIQYGLSNVCENEESSITDEDIETILAKSEAAAALAKGKQATRGKEKTREKEASSSEMEIDTQEGSEKAVKKRQSLSLAEVEHSISVATQEGDNPMYYYEGRDYTEEAKKADADVLESLLKRREPAAGPEDMPMTPRRRFELRGRKVSYDLEKEKLRRMQETMKKRKAKWVKSGYFSSAIRLEFLQPPVQQDAEKELMEDDEDASTQKLEDEDVEAAPEKPWTCQACTFVNEDLTADKCAICEAPREPSKTTAKEEVDRMEEDTTPVEAKEKGKEKEAEGTRPEEPEPEIDEDADIHFVVGDVTRPYEHIESAKAAIIGSCCDNSGNWGTGGLFSALDALSPSPQQMYLQAGQNKDLTLGDLHLVNFKAPQEDPKPDDDLFDLNKLAIKRGADGGGLCVALLIAQRRVRGKISGVLLENLAEAFEKLQLVAHKLSATVHLPRFGSPADWYSIERLIRTNLVAFGIPTYVYYFKRRHGRKRRYAAGSQGGSQSQSESDGDQASHHSQSSASQSSMNWDEPLRKKAKSDSAPSQDEPDKEDDEEITEIMDLGSKKAKTHHPSLDDDADCVPLSATSSSLEALSSGTPLSSAHFFSSCKFYLHLVGKRYSWLRNHIIRFGGKVDNNFTSRLTHLVTCKDNVDEAMKVAQKLNPNIKLVSAGWIDKCISTRKLVSIEPFLLS